MSRIPTPYEALAALFARHGREAYGEAVTQEEHGLQCAACARADGAPAALVVAALLHDVGHLLELNDDAFGLHRHDSVGAGYLTRYFGPEVTEPVRLHVAAKRYLCATEPGYLGRLSAASTYTLGKQGGPMRPEELPAFEAEPYAAQALRLRRWDESGKREGLEIAPLSAYRAEIEALLRPQ